MIYTKVHVDWQDAPSTTTPILSTDLEHMEEGIYQASRSATEAQDGNVQLATPSEMTSLPASLTKVPAVERVKTYVAAQIAAAMATIPGVASATETSSGVVELANTTEMTAGNDTLRVPAVAKVATYVTQAINASAASINAALTSGLAAKADKAASLTQFSDVSDASPTDLAVLRYDGASAAYVPVQLGSLYAPVDAQGRIIESAEPQYYVPMKVINEGDSTLGVPAQTVILSRSAAASLVPTFIGYKEGGSYNSMANTLSFITTDDVEVGDYVIFAIGGGAESTLPIAHTVGYGAGAAALTFGGIVASGTNAFAQQAFGKCTTRIPSGTTITVQNGGQTNNIYNRSQWMVGMAVAKNLAQTNPLAVSPNTGYGNASSPLTLTLDIGTTSVANTLAIATFASNPGAIAQNPVAAPYQRSYAPGSGWTALGPYLKYANATTIRGMQMQYRIYPASGAISATQIVTDNGSYGNSPWAAAGTVLKGA